MSDNVPPNPSKDCKKGGYSLDEYKYHPADMVEELLCGICFGLLDGATNSCQSGHQL